VIFLDIGEILENGVSHNTSPLSVEGYAKPSAELEINVDVKCLGEDDRKCETKRNETERNETDRNETKRNVRSFRFVSFDFVSFRLISFRFIRFRFVSFKS
jgi:hypothetical protein